MQPQPRMIPNLTDVDTFVWVEFEDGGEEVGGQAGDETGDLVVGREDEFVEGVRAFVLEWEEAAQHEVEDYAQGPDVRREGLVGAGLDYLWGGVTWRTAGGGQF